MYFGDSTLRPLGVRIIKSCYRDRYGGPTPIVLLLFVHDDRQDRGRPASASPGHFQIARDSQLEFLTSSKETGYCQRPLLKRVSNSFDNNIENPAT